MKEIVETDDEVFIVLEYIKGGELSNRISSFNPLSESNAKFLFYQIVLAVRYLHLEGVAHRDLKVFKIYIVYGHSRCSRKIKKKRQVPFSLLYNVVHLSL